MARRLSRVVHTIPALALSGALAACQGNTETDRLLSPHDAVKATATAIGALYRSIDDATTDAYVAQTVLDPTLALGTSERCMNTDNRVSTRPSALMNPPLAASSIEQRARLVAVLGAYEVSIASLAGSASKIESVLDVRDLQRDVFELNAAANAHAQGDLFVEDAASKFGSIAAQLGNGDRARAHSVVAAADPFIARLGTIFLADAAQHRAQALGVIRLEYEQWLAYYDAARRSAAPGRSTQNAAVRALPRCFTPRLPPSDASPVPLNAPDDATGFPGSEAILGRLQDARDRYNAVRSTDPIALWASLVALNVAAKNMLDSPDDERRTALRNALLRFQEAAQNLATATRPLEP